MSSPVKRVMTPAGRSQPIIGNAFSEAAYRKQVADAAKANSAVEVKGSTMATQSTKKVMTDKQLPITPDGQHTSNATTSQSDSDKAADYRTIDSGIQVIDYAKTAKTRRNSPENFNSTPAVRSSPIVIPAALYSSQAKSMPTYFSSPMNSGEETPEHQTMAKALIDSKHEHVDAIVLSTHGYTPAKNGSYAQAANAQIVSHNGENRVASSGTVVKVSDDGSDKEVLSSKVYVKKEKKGQATPSSSGSSDIPIIFYGNKGDFGDITPGMRNTSAETESSSPVKYTAGDVEYLLRDLHAKYDTMIRKSDRMLKQLKLDAASDGHTSQQIYKQGGELFKQGSNTQSEMVAIKYESADISKRMATKEDTSDLKDGVMIIQELTREQCDEIKEQGDSHVCAIKDSVSTVQDSVSTVQDSVSTVQDSVSTVQDSVSTVQDSIYVFQELMATKAQCEVISQQTAANHDDIKETVLSEAYLIKDHVGSECWEVQERFAKETEDVKDHITDQFTMAIEQNQIDSARVSQDFKKEINAVRSKFSLVDEQLTRINAHLARLEETAKATRDAVAERNELLRKLWDQNVANGQKLDNNNARFEVFAQLMTTMLTNVMNNNSTSDSMSWYHSTESGRWP